MQTITVTGPDVSSGWLAACQAMYTHRVAYHTVVRIENPLKEDPSVRRALDQLLDDVGLQRVGTVANTIFPVAFARSSKDHLHLSRRYEDALPALRRLSRQNDRGTYFERLIAFPGQDGPVNQLDVVISRLRREIAKNGAGTGAMTAAYEVGFNSPGTNNTDGQDGILLTAEVPVRVPGRDRVFPGFPCLSHCSFQLDRSGALHAMAHYRSQRMIERAYGNYLGLGRLLGYIAEQTELQPGGLTVTAGYAVVDQPRRLSALLCSTSPVTAA